MSGADYEAAPCPCGCGRPVPAGRRWATTSCGNKARAAKRRERCPELRPEMPGEEVWEKLTGEQRQGIMNAAAAHAWADWMLINEKEAAKRETFPSRRRRPDPRTGKKRPRVYIGEEAARQAQVLVNRLGLWSQADLVERLIYEKYLKLQAGGSMDEAGVLAL